MFLSVYDAYVHETDVTVGRTRTKRVTLSQQAVHQPTAKRGTTRVTCVAGTKGDMCEMCCKSWEIFDQESWEIFVQGDMC